MSRPTRKIIASGISAWDADVDFNFALLTDYPFAIYQASSVGTLPSASTYPDCLALVGSTLYISNGTSWEVYNGVSANVPDSVATDATQMATDFNLLLTALKNANIMASS